MKVPGAAVAMVGVWHMAQPTLRRRCCRPARPSVAIGQVSIHRRRLGRAHEQREELDVDALVVDSRNRVFDRPAVHRELIGLQRARDSHLVHVGVRGERDQARLLRFVSETADARGPGLFQHGHVDELAALRGRLPVRDVLQRLVRDRLDEPVAENAQRRSATRTRCVRAGPAPAHAVRSDRLWISEPPGWSRNERPSQKPARFSVISLVAPVSFLVEVVGVERGVGGMAFAAAGRVEDRPEPVGDGFGADELLFGGLEIALVGRESSASWASSPGEPGRAQNSSAKPLDPPSNPVGASVAFD